MKIKIKLLIPFVLGVCSISCVQDDEYNIPDISIREVDIPANSITTFKAIMNRYEQAVANGNATVRIQDEQDLYIQGYVISSDQAGNFFEELIIQNKIDDSSSDADPRLGLKVEINVPSLYNTFEVGRKVYVKINGLTIGLSNGVVAIGKGDANNVKQIQASEYRNIIIRGTEVATITPKVINLFDLTSQDRNTLIQLNDMQMNRYELGRTFAGESYDEFDGFRFMESCQSGVSLLLQTSTFSDFKSLIIPNGKGNIQGVFARDFGDDFDVFIINSSADINFDEARCDPIELDCGLTDTAGTANLFYEDFESQTNNRLIQGNGWINYIEAGSEGWEGFSSTSSNASLGRSARVQTASSGDFSNITWLITPAIDLNNYHNATLRFKTSNSLADGSFLEVLYSLDWDGNEANITSATWGVLPAAYIVKDTDSFVPWFNSGTVDLSCATGIMHIAFKYTGSGQDAYDGVYELDDVSIDYVP
ncbi:hypothetical protein APS56_10015 [Pseudalgibacter alginicilyticus]|uniref:DUF5689 domain-containing protein n=1 Tax=Pseudalgibacter alginicilyticus TaxID=1736674 RepID=A0A0P0DBG2_9FLAO|nr:DUF5689 domain-containing protein [Pseudalgibacter alginicilyticus]ALJ05432.1 hypothetical protein APS56_10015 [Pseudalgibacter alginicilyticus]